MAIGLITALILCALIVACSLPEAGWRMMWQNCHRRDGSFSQRRFRRECASIGSYLTSVLLPLVLVFLPLFLSASILFTYIIPYDMVVRTFLSFDSDFSEWKDGLVDIREEHSDFLQSQSISGPQIQSLQRALWSYWPVIGGISVVLTAASIVAFLRCTRIAVNVLATGVRSRRSIYWRTDMQRMEMTDPAFHEAVPRTMEHS